MQSIFLSKSKSIRSIMRSKTKWKNPIKGASWTIKRRPPIFDGFDHSFHPKDTPPWLDYFCSNNLRFWGFVFWEYIAIKQICLFEKKTPVHIYIYIYICLLGQNNAIVIYNLSLEKKLYWVFVYSTYPQFKWVLFQSISLPQVWKTNYFL